MSTPLTMAKTMPTILRLELDEVVVEVLRSASSEDIGTRAGWGFKRRGRGNVRGRHCRGSIQERACGRRRLEAVLVGGEVEEK